MRDYLYIWHDSDKKRLIASGIEFKDYYKLLGVDTAFLTLSHKFPETRWDMTTRLEFVLQEDITPVPQDEIYNFGDLCWVDFPMPEREPFIFQLNDESIAELLFFKHMARPLTKVQFKELGNNFLGYAHDDGYYLALYYEDWNLVEELLTNIYSNEISGANLRQLLVELKKSEHGLWLKDNVLEFVKKTHDIDNVLIEKYQNMT